MGRRLLIAARVVSCLTTCMALRLESGRAGISCNALSVGGQQGTKSLKHLGLCQGGA